jgi:hypothetical protein
MKTIIRMLKPWIIKFLLAQSEKYQDKMANLYMHKVTLPGVSGEEQENNFKCNYDMMQKILTELVEGI